MQASAGECRRNSLVAQLESLSDQRQFLAQPPTPQMLVGRPTNVALFHPTCFTCSTCKEFLVDLVYCLRDNKLYCLRHYGESLRPRCNWCQEVSRTAHLSLVPATTASCRQRREAKLDWAR